MKRKEFLTFIENELATFIIALSINPPTTDEAMDKMLEKESEFIAKFLESKGVLKLTEEPKPEAIPETNVVMLPPKETK